MIDLNEMIVFVKVAESGSFIGASRALNMPTATVSRRIASLEKRLNVRLVHRTTRHVGLTDEGEQLFLRAAPVIREAVEVEQSILTLSQEPQGLLRLTSTPLFAKQYLTPVMQQYLKLYPKVEIDLLATTRTVNLIEEGFDMGIRSGMLQDSTLNARRLSAGHSVVCASPEYLKTHGKVEKLDDLLLHECVRFTPPGRKFIGWNFQTNKGLVNLPVSGRLKVNSYELACAAAVRGIGVAYVPAIVAEPEIKAGRLQALLQGLEESNLTLFAVYPSHRQLSLKIRKFIDLLVTAIE